jgi:hypothetical protein
MKDINAKMFYTSVTGLTQSNIEVINEVVTTSGKRYYEMKIAEELYGKSYAQLDRYIAKLNNNISDSYIKINDKKFLSPSILHQCKRKTEVKERVEEDGLKLVINDQVLSDEYRFNITGTTVEHTGVMYFDINQSYHYLGIKEREVRSLIPKINERYRYEYCLSYAKKHYVSPLVMILTKKRSPLLKNIDYANFARRYGWCTAGTVRFQNDMSPDASCKLMKALFDKLKRTYPQTFNYFFHVTEINPDQLGTHSHFVYGNHSYPPAEEVEAVIQNFLGRKGGRWEKKSLIEKYNHDDYYLEYMVKQMHVLPNHYNWYHHNLII